MLGDSTVAGSDYCSRAPPNLTLVALALARTNPDSWKADVEQCIHAARESLLEDHIVPDDLIQECPPDQALGVMQRLVFRFGELLEFWPDMWEAARNLKENGRTLAVPL